MKTVICSPGWPLKSSGASHVVLYPGVPGYEDDFLIRADKNPNTRGAQDMGLPAPATATQLAAIGAGD